MHCTCSARYPLTPSDALARLPPIQQRLQVALDGARGASDGLHSLHQEWKGDKGEKACGQLLIFSTGLACEKGQ